MGGFLIEHLPKWVFVSSILFAFLISGILRLLASLMLLPTLKEARLIELDIGHSFFKRYLTIRPSEGLIFEVIDKYHKIKDRIIQTKDIITKKRKMTDEDSRTYTKKLLKFIDKSVSPKKEQHDITNMHEIEHLTEEIEKGQAKK